MWEIWHAINNGIYKSLKWLWDDPTSPDLFTSGDSWKQSLQIRDFLFWKFCSCFIFSLHLTSCPTCDALWLIVATSSIIQPKLRWCACFRHLELLLCSLKSQTTIWANLVQLLVHLVVWFCSLISENVFKKYKYFGCDYCSFKSGWILPESGWNRFFVNFRLVTSKLNDWNVILTIYIFHTERDRSPPSWCDAPKKSWRRSSCRWMTRDETPSNTKTRSKLFFLP